ncbi:MAG: winged helix DNA-binding domain-containing protein [Methanocella sp.]
MYRDDTANISPEQVRAMRICAQHLHQKAPVDSLAAVVRSLGGVNAQSGPAMMLSLRARIKGLEPADVKRAMENRTLVRTWAMRGTIHLVDSNDLGWMVSLLGPFILAKGRRRRLELGLDDEKISRGLEVMGTILADEGPLTRDALTDALIEHGIGIERKTQAPYHLVAYAALTGLVCIGPDTPEGEWTYGLVSEWTGKQKVLTGEEALAGLAIRYLQGYGPASPQDFSAWSGLPVADARKGWKLAVDREALQEIRVGDRTLRSPKSLYQSLEKPAHGRKVVNLLPAFDTLVLGYADRKCLVPKRYMSEVYHGGQTVPVVLVDGIAAGVWRYERRGRKMNIMVSPFESFDDTTGELINEEAEDIGRFFGLPVSLAIG